MGLKKYFEELVVDKFVSDDVVVNGSLEADQQLVDGQISDLHYELIASSELSDTVLDEDFDISQVDPKDDIILIVRVDSADTDTAAIKLQVDGLDDSSYNYTTNDGSSFISTSGDTSFSLLKMGSSTYSGGMGSWNLSVPRSSVFIHGNGRARNDDSEIMHSGRNSSVQGFDSLRVFGAGNGGTVRDAKIEVYHRSR